MELLKSWKYKNITLLVVAFVAAYFLGSYGPFKEFIFDAGYIAAFFSGVIFISTFTAPFGALIMLVLAQKLPLVSIWIIASTGAVISDYLFFYHIKDGLAEEITPIYESITGKTHLHKLINTKHFRWMFPIAGALIILSPFPKTPGLHLLGIPKLKSHEFLMLSAGINIIGIIFILFLSFFIKP